MKYLLLLLSLLQWSLLTGQCNYLAYDGFGYDSNIAMNGLAGGTGWLSPWSVQNGDVATPGFNTVASSLPYNDLQVTGDAASGGSNYVSMGRSLNTEDSGPFASYIVAGSEEIGTETGGTLWSSFILSKNQDNDQPTFVSMHNDKVGWCHNCSTQRIAVGYFSANSNSNGQRYWTLLLNYTYYLSPILVVEDEPTFFVVRTTFVAGNTQVDLFINPNTLGDKGIPAATLSQSTGSGNIIKGIATQLGDTPGNASMDELRIGTSYECVAPDGDTDINLPPTASISMTPNSGTSPISVTLQGSGSSDPENQPLTYLWDFGDGGSSSTLANPPPHNYDDVGQLTVSLTVTDDTGQQHTAYETLTLLDSNGTFPCQTTVTCLQMASCAGNDGMLQVHAGDNFYTLRDAANQVLNPSIGAQYHNLAVGNYTLSVVGNGSVCEDSFVLKIQTDSSTCAGWQPSKCAMDIGTNLNGIADWSVERPFKNLMKNIRPAIITSSDACGCFDGEVSGELALDDDGYPTFLPQATTIGATRVSYVLSTEGGNLIGGNEYVLLYDGVGSMNIIGVSGIISTANRMQFTAGPGDIILTLTESSNGDHIRNFRLVRLSDENADLVTQPFYSGFTDKVAPFSLLRFMDWGATNNSPLSSWAERSTTSYFTYGTEGGVPYEMMVQLANQLQKDIWLCVPHLADDNYIAQMSTFFKDNLDEGITVYIEYSNEVWNWIFEQTYYNNDFKPSHLSRGRAMAARAKNVFDIWHDAFTGEECRVKRVLGLQARESTINRDILSHLSSEDWDYGSPTHYFGLDHSEGGNPVLTHSSTIQDVMQNARNSFAVFSPIVKQDYLNVQIYGKEVITYEGGQHFVGEAFGVVYAYQDTMWEAQNSPEMYDMYNAVLDSIRTWGCRLAGNFTLSSAQESIFGSWGALPDIDVLPPYSDNAKKYQVLLDNMPDGNCLNRNSWNGDQSVNWSNPCNWSQNRIPNATDDVLIPASTRHAPNVDVNGEANSLTLVEGAVLRIMTGILLEVQ